jgi:sulfite exporter TauE/SafE
MISISALGAIAFITFLASFHCIGMCGGFALCMASGATGARSNLARQFLYSGGRITTYLCLGAAAGWLGLVVTSAGALTAVTAALSIIAGVVMLGLGLHHLGWLPAFTLRFVSKPPAWFTRWMGKATRLSDPVVPYVLGVMTGFLPCGLVAGWLIQAATTRSPLQGLLVMTAMGLGTVPAMVATGMAPSYFTMKWRERLLKASGVALVLFGVFTLARSVPMIATSGDATEGEINCIGCLLNWWD